jgi:hypothetical protein
MNSLQDSNDSVPESAAAEPAAPIDAAEHPAGADPAAEAIAASAAPEAMAEAIEAISGQSAESAPAAVEAAAAPAEPKAAPEVQSEVRPPIGGLIPFIALRRAEAPPRPKVGEIWRLASDRRVQFGAAAAALALAGVITASSISYGNQQAQSLEAQNVETQNIEETVKTLKARIAALEAVRRDEVADLRKTAAEVKTGLAGARDASSTLAQLNLRFDRLEHDQDSRIEKLGERVDHDAATHNADFAARLEKLEKKLAAPVAASIAPPQIAPAAPPPKPSTVALAAPAALAAGPGVSKETTGSIAPARPLIRGWTVREVHDGMALVAGPYGYRQIGPGDSLPGAGRVERIERSAAGWTVVTDQGLISGSYGASPYRGAAYGAFNGGYGPEGEF